MGDFSDWHLELKLEIIEKYGAAYTKAFARTPNLKKYYIDGFSGAGVHVSKRTKAAIEGSPARAEDRSAVRRVLFHRSQRRQNRLSPGDT